MSNFLTPVVYNFFLRTDIILLVINEIKKLKPQVLYLVSDGPRNESEKHLVNLNRSLVSSLIDWECSVIKVYFDSNKGFDSVMDHTYEGVFKSYDRMIFLEEDILPTQSFFRYCEELLEFYKTDEQIFLITGMNFLENYPLSGPSYFFSNGGSTWGMALWKRTYEKFQKNLDFLDNNYYHSIVRSRMKAAGKNSSYQHLMLKKNKPELIPYDGEFWLMGFNQNILFNSLAIVPSRNLVRNIGDSPLSENSDDPKLLPKKLRRVGELKSHDLTFPLIHPEFRIVDYFYSETLYKLNKQDLLSSILIKLERGLRLLLFGNLRYFIKKLKGFFDRKLIYEREKNKFK
jgi:hypothetical protein